MNVLSLFDGISCGQISLERARIPYDNYFSSEIDKYAIKVTQHNYPNTIQLGDINNWKEWNIDWKTIDLIFAGFPCQSWSIAGKQKGDNDPRGQLVHVLIEILNHIKSNNQNVKFLFENVRMKKEFIKYIDSLFEVKSILIDSASVSAQRRNRLYWTNIPNITQPEDKGIVLKDIIHENTFTDSDKSYCIDANYFKGDNPVQYYIKKRRQQVYDIIKEYIVPFNKTLQILEKEIQRGKVGFFRKDGQANRVYFIHDKAITLCGEAGGGAAKMGQYGFLKGEKMFGYIYITINNINGKKYIGKHKSSKFEENYLGSGKALLDSLKKYNKDDYDVVMLKACVDEEELNNAEYEIIKEHNAIQSNDYYNLKDGGNNGFSGGSHSEETKKKMILNNMGCNNPFYGKTHTKETKEKIGNMERGVNNHNYGGLSKEHSIKIGNALRGKEKTEDHKESLRGKRETVSCPHCGLLGGISNMKRYHFDNCKFKQYLFGCITPDRINKRQNGQRFSDSKKFYTLTSQDQHGILIEGYIRKLTPIECERLQTLPDNYTEGISNTQRYKMLGNAWTVDVIVHILSNIQNNKENN